MTINCSRDFTDEYIIFSFSDDKLLTHVTNISDEICHTLQEFPYKKIIIDYSDTEKQLFFLDWIKIIRIVHKGTKFIKICLVDSKKEIPERTIIEAILFNSGIIFRTFNSLDEAKDWISC